MIELAPAKINLVLRVGAAPAGRLPRGADADDGVDLADVLAIARPRATVVRVPRAAGGRHARDACAGRRLAAVGPERCRRSACASTSASGRCRARRRVVRRGGGAARAPTGCWLAARGWTSWRRSPRRSVPTCRSSSGRPVQLHGGEACNCRPARRCPRSRSSSPTPAGRSRPATSTRRTCARADRRQRAARVDPVPRGARRDLVANDLGPVAEQLEPGCRALRLELVARGAAAACVTGSGSAVFGLFSDLASATAAAASLPGAAWARAATLSAS